ncbi:formate dehydrogenase biogenesis protein FdhT [Campylobacter avium LMG 24591]|uniref:Formate dehydrogenase biogenesis protein FdhT n=1 Tax=Campylobacter avium LMG 24591 TaxID=522484 RepID=A0A222MX84_9BACT|nr:selenium metabolism membrane protein YedE/FdhT [Campylobacter avium]ASQ30519.1 formate dehydrogenase biogenesis protein FdhT [Campylobacter avium LMG 24591]OYD79616.1 formate dehydrogenase biogenesis protein FdhT [Campylobacter avium]
MNEIKQKYLINFWENKKGFIALGVFSAAYFGIFAVNWGVTSEMTRLGGEFLELFGADLSSYSYYQNLGLHGNATTRISGIMLLGMSIGCIVAALLANKVKFRLPASSLRVFQAIVGGLLSGFGARLAFGCNLGNFFSGIPYFSLHTWLFALFMVLGIYLAVKLTNTKFFKPKAKLVRVNKKDEGLEIHEKRAKFYFFLGIFVFVLFLSWLLYLLINYHDINPSDRKSMLSLALVFGFIFGFIISKCQICFTSCFRDLFLFGRDSAIKGAIIGMMIATIIAFAFTLYGHEPKLTQLSLSVAMGAFLFGFGIVFAGACECGWAYRMWEGQSHFMIVGAANIAGTMILALSYDFFPQGFKEGVKINLLDSFSNLGGLALNLLFLLSMLILALAYKRYFFKRIQR